MFSRTVRRLSVAVTVAFVPFVDLGAQGTTNDARDVLAVVQRLFDAMRAKDTAVVRSLFADDGRFALIDSRSAAASIRTMPIDGWLRSMANSSQRWDERTYDVEVRVDERVSHVWAPYTFYVDGKIRHCGVDSIELLRDATGWKITQISDTQRTQNCREVP